MIEKMFLKTFMIEKMFLKTFMIEKMRFLKEKMSF